LNLTITHNPDVALWLLAVGAIGIYWELCAPGRVVPGVLGAALAVMGIASLAGLPVHWPGAALMLAGMCFFALEAASVSRGVFTAIGAAAMLFGAKILVQIHWATAIGVAIPFSVASSFLLSVAARARRNKLRDARAIS
jgi:membrane-bound serine protease (ClpP class)